MGKGGQEDSKFIHNSTDAAESKSPQKISLLKHESSNPADFEGPVFKKDSSNERVWNILAYILITLNIILLLSILGVTLKWRSERGSPPAKEEQQLCLPCDSLTNHPQKNYSHLEKDFSIKHERNKAICCGKTSKHLDAMVDMFVEQKYRENRGLSAYKHIPEGCTNVTKETPAARVVGLKHHLIGKKADTVLAWNEDAKMSFKKGGIQYSNNCFIVNETGYYYIYSQLTSMDKRLHRFTQDSNMLHSVHRYNERSQELETLLEGTNSRCKIVSKEGNSTSYVGAVFKLEINDKVMVRISNPESIAWSDYGNFFGIYLI